MKADTLLKFRTLVKAASDRAEADVMEDLAAHLEARGKEFEKLTADLKAAKEELAAEKAKPKAEEKKAEDPEVTEERAADISEGIEDMVKAGNLTPALAASLKVELCGTAEHRNGFMLSRVGTADATGIRPVRAKALLNIIKQIKPSPLKPEKTGGQAFSREDNTTPAVDDKLVDRLVGMITPPKDAGLVM